MATIEAEPQSSTVISDDNGGRSGEIQVQVPSGVEGSNVDGEPVTERFDELRRILSKEVPAENEHLPDDAPERGEQTDVHPRNAGEGRGRETDVGSEGGTRPDGGRESTPEADATVADSTQGEGDDIIVPTADGVRTDEENPELRDEHGKAESSTDAEQESERDSASEDRSSEEETIIGYDSSGEVCESSRFLIGGIWL